MANLVDTTEWREFELGQLFRIVPTKGKKSTDLVDGNDLPYVAASKECNGVKQYVSVDGFEHWVSEGGCLVFVQIGDGAAGTTLYHPEDFIGMAGKTACGYPIGFDMTDNIAMFVQSSLNSSNNGRFDFKESWTGERLRKTKLKLPATPDGKPDWDYMERYMAHVMDEMRPVAEELHSLDSKLTRHKLDTTEWKMFKVGDLFEVDNTKCVVARDIVLDSGDIPYVTSSSENNGVMTHVSASSEMVNAGRCLFIGGKTSTVSWQEDDFVSNDSHNLTLRHAQLDGPSGRYIASFLATMLSQKFEWGNAASKAKVLELEIPLPVDAVGNPDWDYMSHTHTHICEEMRPLAEALFSLRG